MTRIATHPASKARSLASTAALLVVALFLGACETTGLPSLSGGDERRALQLAESGRHADAARAYIGLATAAFGVERDRLTLLAAEQWIDAGDVNRATSAMRNVARPATDPLLALWDTNGAAMALYRGDADAALAILEPMSARSLPRSRRLRAEALRADAWIQKGDPARAVELMTQREMWLDNARGVERNRNRLWRGLLVSNPQTLRTAAEINTNPQTRGWLTLASIATSTGQQGVGWSNGVARWREANPDHPAIELLGNVRDADREPAAFPRQVALLLPLSGRQAASGSAIQNGFLGAYFATAGALDDRQVVRIYDVDAEGGASAAYQTAVSDGAEFVVGPLLKSSVDELANDILVPVPVLTLNYLSEDTLAPPGLYQFALSPEDEAASVATRALGDGFRHAVALVPDNDWGRRVMRSFATEFEGLGGTLLDYRNYSIGKQDYSVEIETLMGLSGSIQRFRRLRANIGEFSMQFDPRRRTDAEFIFVAADVGHARLLKSQLKFHYSGDIPVFSTSTVNVRDGRSNSDLNGIMFADAPWLIDPHPWIQPLPAAYQRYWPRENERLHAMGFDAYNLIASIYTSRGGPMEELDGATGRLFLDQYGRVHRKLAWAQFQDGKPVALPRHDELGGPIRDISDDTGVIDPDAADAAPWENRQH